MIGFISILVTHSLLITLKYRQYSAITDLHTFQFTVVHTLGFSVSISLLATDLSMETITQITTSITPKIFQLHFQYHCTTAHIIFYFTRTIFTGRPPVFSCAPGLAPPAYDFLDYLLVTPFRNTNCSELVTTLHNRGTDYRKRMSHDYHFFCCVIQAFRTRASHSNSLSMLSRDIHVTAAV
jgi:hypothetical protein